MENVRVISALIGLTGAVSNNGKTEQTDGLVANALTSGDSDEIVEMIHREKFRISPDCEVCKSPCGNTSDFSIEELVKGTEEVQTLKAQIVFELRNIGNAVKKGRELPELTYKAITYLKYELAEDSYKELLEEMRLWLER